jgi:hypothetical protein
MNWNIMDLIRGAFGGGATPTPTPSPTPVPTVTPVPKAPPWPEGARIVQAGASGPAVVRMPPPTPTPSPTPVPYQQHLQEFLQKAQGGQ